MLVLGGIGFWLLVVNAVALRKGGLARVHAAIGVGLAVFTGAAVLAAIIQSELLDRVAAGVGAVFAPVWYVWAGARLLRKATGLHTSRT